MMTNGGKNKCFHCRVDNGHGTLGPEQLSLPAHRSLSQPSKLAQDTTGLHQSDNIDAQSISITSFDEVDHHSNTDKLHHRYHLLQEQHLLERYERFLKEVNWLSVLVTLTIEGCDDDHLDDQHFCSILCDHGYKVHVIYSDEDLVVGHPTPKLKRKHPLSEVMQWILKGSTTARNVAIIGQEITTMKLLNFLSEVVKAISQTLLQ